MASLELDPASGRYRVRFRFGGQAFKRSLRTKSRRVAAASLGQVEEVLRMLQLGLTELPEEVDEGACDRHSKSAAPGGLLRRPDRAARCDVLRGGLRS